MATSGRTSCPISGSVSPWRGLPACRRTRSGSIRDSGSPRTRRTTSKSCASSEGSRRSGYPVLLGTSRKSTIGRVLGAPVDDRLDGTGATLVWGIQQGCGMVRVHDVATDVAFRADGRCDQGGPRLEPMTPDTLTLSRMRFHSRHGVLPEEAVRGQDFEVTVRLDLPLAEAGRADDLSRTIDYRAIHEVVRSVMGGRAAAPDRGAGRSGRGRAARTVPADAGRRGGGDQTQSAGRLRQRRRGGAASGGPDSA